MVKFSLIKIEDIKTEYYEGNVYDLSIEEDASYNIKGIIVHNSACTTTDMTGIGCPPITALYYGWLGMENYPERSLILDGGIKKPADLVKSIVCGADAIMCGSIFSGCKETPGEVYVKINKKIPRITEGGETYGIEIPIDDRYKYKKFRGMASKSVQEDYDLWDGTTENLFVEGKEIEVPYTNESVTNVVYRYVNGLRSAMSYLGFNNLQELKGSLWNGKTKAIRIN